MEILRKIRYCMALCFVLSLTGIFFMGCAGHKITMEPVEVQTFINEAEESVIKAQNAGAYEMAPEKIARAESLMDRAKYASQDKERGVESIKLASDAKTHAEVAYAITREKKLTDQEMRRISLEKSSEIAGLEAAKELAVQSEREKIRQLESCRKHLQQIEKEKEDKIADLQEALKSEKRKNSDIVWKKEQELENTRQELIDTRWQLTEVNRKLKEYSERIAQIEKENQLELELVRESLRDAESRARKAEAQVAELERKTQKEIAVHVAREEHKQKKIQKAQIKREELKGKPSFDMLKDVRQVLEGWQLAWKMSDADRYTSYYWDKAEIRKITISDGKEQIEEFDINQMRSQMENIFSRGPSYKIGEPKLEAGSDAARATFEFFKETPAEAYNKEIIKHDKWIKELLFRKIKGNWKIVRENWNIYKGIPEYTRKW